MRLLVINRIEKLCEEFPMLPEYMNFSVDKLNELSNIQLLDLLEEILLECYNA